MLSTEPPGARWTPSPSLPSPLLFPVRSAPLVRCRRRGLGAVPGEGGGSRAGGGSQDEASDSAPSRSGLQCSSYKRNDGSVSCFLGISGRSGSERSAVPHRPLPCPVPPSTAAGRSRAPSPFLPPAIPGVPEALGKRVVVDLKLRDLRGPRGRRQVRMRLFQPGLGHPEVTGCPPRGEPGECTLGTRPPGIGCSKPQGKVRPVGGPRGKRPPKTLFEA